MGNKPEEIWTEKDEQYLRRNWGWLPLRTIARNLGRTELAVIVRRKRLGILPIKDWPEIRTEWQLAPMLSVDRKTVWRWMRDGVIPTMRLWRSNKPVLVVDLSELRAWLSDPDNWCKIDIDNIQDLELRAVVARARRKFDDQWLTTGEAAERIYCSHRWVSELIRRGRLPAHKHGNWRIRLSDLDQMARSMGYQEVPMQGTG